MEYIGSVNFDLVQISTCRARPAAAGDYTISELLEEIVGYAKRYFESDDLQSRWRSLGKELKLDVQFLYNTSVGESVGLKSMGDIESVIDTYTDISQNAVHDSVNLLKGEERKETVNLYRALEYASKLRVEMENTGKVTVQQICDIHRVLMTELRSDAGEIRKHDVYTVCKDGEIHLYPEPVVAEQILYACVDHHCIQMSRLEKLPIDELLSLENVEFIFKRAARLLFDFVDAHPFGDGNGRTCRLLANYVTSLITPFPVTPTCGGKNMKEDYLKAIIECRDHRDKGPGALASMLIVDTWRGWERFFQSIDSTCNES